MNKQDRKVLACVDQSHFADTVADYAAWAARRMDAPLELLHVIDRHLEQGSGDDHSGAIGFNAQEHLLHSLSDKDAALARSKREQGRIFLNHLRERALAAGAPSADMRQRHGALDDTLAEQEDNVRLFVFGRRGASAAKTRPEGSNTLGRNVERVVRAIHKPILTVTEGFKEPERVMLAYDGSAVTRKGVDMIAGSPLFKGLPIHIVMAGKDSADAPKQVAWAKDTLTAAGFEVVADILSGDPEAVIAREIRARDIDMLLMGAYAHSPLRALLFGSKTTDLLRAATIPTLLLR
ncbi:MAG TPA: universal stress protein [Thauera sp.]|uniref:universal stress protein n=1 Tax=Thauera sp. 28 TaxID=303682 RepID=UPI0002CEEA54|nr:universal stress protein [Thauera sp. 28]HAY09220.1 universal stress protein [Thauera sp.]ENO92897.1 UspA [Thauera sp. 28]HNR61758.1 universal stress protein [Thauera sp.]HNS91406.1 universal stress protein [Thauera sp.]HRJ23338.1 universal stress protein [Thauera sp.]